MQLKPAVKWKTGRSGKQVFTIDVLAARDQAAAGTLAPGDRALINRVLPGVLQSAVHKPAAVPPCPACGGNHEVCMVVGPHLPTKERKS